MEDKWRRPSEIFGARLREMRKARGGMSQTELAERMTDAGRPLGKPALLRIENGTRGLLLDEAFALAQCLGTSPANLLNPPEGEVVALTDNMAVDGETLRDWFVTGNPFGSMVWPAKPGDDDEALLERNFERRVTSYAQALIDADNANDQAGRVAALRALRTAVEDYRDPARLAERIELQNDQYRHQRASEGGDDAS